MKREKLLFIIGIYIIFSFVFTNKVIAANNDKLLIIDDVSVWKYKKNTWYNTSFNNSNKFTVYINNELLGTYNIKNSNNIVLYDNDNNTVEHEGNLLAFSTNFNIKPNNYTIQEITNNNLLEINNLLGSSFTQEDFSIDEYIMVDLDNNGIIDEIVNVSNLDALNPQSKYFNLLYIKMNGSRQIIINDNVKESDILNAPVYNIKYIFSIDNNYNSIVLEKGYFSNAGETTNLLYEYKNGTYVETTINNEKSNKNNNNNSNEDYTLYIFCGILLVIMLCIYFIINKIKNNKDVMDD